MYAVASFHSSATTSSHLNAVLSDYMALERARRYRRVLTTRLGLTALAIGVAAGFQWVSTWIAAPVVGFCLVPPAWAWIVELECDARVARRLKVLPGSVTQVIDS